MTAINRIGLLLFVLALTSFPTPGIWGGVEVILLNVGALMFIWGSK